MDARTFVSAELIRYPTWDRVDGQPRMISAYVYQPRSSGPHPVVINIHGGPESQYRPDFDAFTQFLVNELGYVVIAPNVRGSSGYGKGFLALDNGVLREDAVKDIGSLLVWIGLQHDLDRDRVVVMGGSYGGYMALASLAAYNDRLRGGIDVVGISNFVTFLTSTSAYRRDLRRAEYGDERDPRMRGFLSRISPLTNAAADPPAAARRAGPERPARAAPRSPSSWWRASAPAAVRPGISPRRTRATASGKRRTATSTCRRPPCSSSGSPNPDVAGRATYVPARSLTAGLTDAAFGLQATACCLEKNSAIASHLVGRQLRGEARHDRVLACAFLVFIDRARDVVGMLASERRIQRRDARHHPRHGRRRTTPATSGTCRPRAACARRQRRCRRSRRRYRPCPDRRALQPANAW